MSKYILNIKSGTIHSAENPCVPCRKAIEANKKYFDHYEEAVNYFEGNRRKGTPCGRCLRARN